jgi:hypothetical protein
MWLTAVTKEEFINRLPSQLPPSEERGLVA